MSYHDVLATSVLRGYDNVFLLGHIYIKHLKIMLKLYYEN